MSITLVTGATGYLGGNLVPELLKENEKIRCLARHPEDLENKEWFDQVETQQGDVLKPETLEPAFKDVETLYYLIHSMETGTIDFKEKDKQAALNVAKAAKEAGVKHIIYMSGLGDSEAVLSEHLKSRQETAVHLASTGIAVTELRAAIVIGSGSTSFEMIRYLTERMPILPMPRWANTRVQPIAMDDVIAYLLELRKKIPEGHAIIEIACPEVLTYKELMLRYAEQRSLKRPSFKLAFFPLGLAAYFTHLITPIPRAVAKPLLEGLKIETIVKNKEPARALIVMPMRFDEALKKALDRREEGSVATLWRFYKVEPESLEPEGVQDKEGLLFDTQVREINAQASEVYGVVTSIGGKNGWFAYNWLWQLRGLMDTAIGGVGLRPGRRSSSSLRVGDALDFWRVESLKENEYLQLRAEMKMPGRGWLRFDITETDEGKTKLNQTAYYEPKGLFGYAYWWAVYPLHLLVFPGMINAIAKRSEAKGKA